MTQKFLNHDDRNTVFQQMRGVAGAQSMGVHLFGDACFFRNGFYYPLHTALAVAGIEIFAGRPWSPCAERINLFNIPVMVPIE